MSADQRAGVRAVRLQPLGRPTDGPIHQDDETCRLAQSCPPPLSDPASAVTFWSVEQWPRGQASERPAWVSCGAHWPSRVARAVTFGASSRVPEVERPNASPEHGVAPASRRPQNLYDLDGGLIIHHRDHDADHLHCWGGVGHPCAPSLTYGGVVIRQCAAIGKAA